MVSEIKKIQFENNNEKKNNYRKWFDISVSFKRKLFWYSLRLKSWIYQKWHFSLMYNRIELYSLKFWIFSDYDHPPWLFLYLLWFTMKQYAVVNYSVMLSFLLALFLHDSAVRDPFIIMNKWLYLVQMKWTVAVCFVSPNMENVKGEKETTRW